MLQLNITNGEQLQSPLIRQNNDVFDVWCLYSMNKGLSAERQLKVSIKVDGSQIQKATCDVIIEAIVTYISMQH